MVYLWSIQKCSRNELTRLVMGTILVNIILPNVMLEIRCGKNSEIVKNVVYF